jgi:hypothetical protein
MYVVRSFDVNKPGSDPTKMLGGVLGGAVAKGRFKAGEKVEIRPGIKINNKAKKEAYEPVDNNNEPEQRHRGDRGCAAGRAHRRIDGDGSRPSRRRTGWWAA